MAYAHKHDPGTEHDWDLTVGGALYLHLITDHDHATSALSREGRQALHDELHTPAPPHVHLGDSLDSDLSALRAHLATEHGVVASTRHVVGQLETLAHRHQDLHYEAATGRTRDGRRVTTEIPALGPLPRVDIDLPGSAPASGTQGATVLVGPDWKPGDPVPDQPETARAEPTPFVITVRVEIERYGNCVTCHQPTESLAGSLAADDLLGLLRSTTKRAVDDFSMNNSGPRLDAPFVFTVTAEASL